MPGSKSVGCLCSGGYVEAGVDALAVVQEREGHGAVEVERGVVEDVVPVGIFDVVEVDDGVAGADAGGGDGAGRGDVVGDGGAGLVLVDLVVGHADAEHEAEGEDEVGDGAGEGDEHALPARMVVELAGVVGVVFAGDLAGELDVAAEGQEVDLVFGLAVAEADEAFAEADGEGFDADAAPFCRR